MKTAYSRFDEASPMRGERLITAGRVALAAFSVLALLLDPAEPSVQSRFAFDLLLGYLAASIFISVFALRSDRRYSALLAIVAHVVDMFMFAILMYLSTGVSSPFFVFFTFAMASATVRWQRRGLLWTAGAALTTMIVLAAWQSLIVKDPNFELNRSIVRATYLVVMAAVLGHLGAFERRRRNEISSLATWPRPAPHNLEVLLTENLRQAAELLHVKRTILLWEDSEEPWLEVAEWTGTSLDRRREPPDAFEPIVADAVKDEDFYVEDAETAQGVVVRASGEVRNRWQGQPVNPELVRRFGLKRVLGFPIRTDIITGHLFIEGDEDTSGDDLALGRIAARRIGEALDAFLLGRQLNALAVLEERQRLSNELHDGILQTLAAIGFELRRAELSVEADPQGVRSTLQEAQRQLAEEQRDIRFFVQGLRHSVSLATGLKLDERLSELVQRIETVWGVRIKATIELDDTSLTATQEHQLFRIAQEAVVNAARHGGADEVKLEIAQQDGAVHVAVADNGHGFPFTGRYDSAALEEAHIGPVTLKARVKSLGGEMSIESRKDGARLEVRVPLPGPSNATA